MIHHISIPAENPFHVAKVLAEIFDGSFAQFPPNPGSYISFPADEYGTAVEVYPLGTEMIPGKDDRSVEFQQNSSPSRFIATHAAISVQLSQEQIEQIAAREGWRAVRCNRDGQFDVIEFWIENAVMLELLPPEMTLQYTKATDPQKLAEFFAAENHS
ncbi:MAG: hypothetical protein AB4426_05570 [Xenococcaceae cyanobacterium]